MQGCQWAEKKKRVLPRLTKGFLRDSQREAKNVWETRVRVQPLSLSLSIFFSHPLVKHLVKRAVWTLFLSHSFRESKDVKKKEKKHKDKEEKLHLYGTQVADLSVLASYMFFFWIGNGSPASSTRHTLSGQRSKRDAISRVHHIFIGDAGGKERESLHFKKNTECTRV